MFNNKLGDQALNCRCTAFCDMRNSHIPLNVRGIALIVRSDGSAAQERRYLATATLPGVESSATLKGEEKKKSALGTLSDLSP